MTPEAQQLAGQLRATSAKLKMWALDVWGNALNRHLLDEARAIDNLLGSLDLLENIDRIAENRDK